MTVFLECKPDETLAMVLGVPRKSIVHANDKGGVCKRLCDSRGNIGMMDEDPMSAQPTYIRGLSEVRREYGLVQLADPSRSHRIVVLCPRLEEWFLTVCRDANVDVRRFTLSRDSRDLHREINFKLDNFRRALNELLVRQAPAMVRLRSLLTDMV